jgi:hypothetical protein
LELWLYCLQGPSRDIEGEEYCLKLRAALAEKYDGKQLEELLASASCRKPVVRVRHMRGRTVDSVTENEGLSYLDHHPGESVPFAMLLGLHLGSPSVSSVSLYNALENLHSSSSIKCFFFPY